MSAPHDTPNDSTDRQLRIRPLGDRKNLVDKSDFAQVLEPVEGFLTWFEALPDIYGSKSLKRVVSAIVEARQHGREVGMSLGAHVLKVGLSPLLATRTDEPETRAMSTLRCSSCSDSMSRRFSDASVARRTACQSR